MILFNDKRPKPIKKQFNKSIYNNDKLKDLLKEFFIYLLQANIVYKEIMLSFNGEDEKMIDMCNKSIDNSKKAINNILDDKYKSLMFYNYVMQNLNECFGEELALVLSYVSGSFSSDRSFEYDNNFYKEEQKRGIV